MKMERIEKEIIFNYSFDKKHIEKAAILQGVADLIEAVEEGGNYQITVGKIYKQFPNI